MSRKAARLVALYNVPEADQALFEQQFFEDHLPLVKKLPGLRSIETLLKPENLQAGKAPYFLIVTLLFDNMSALHAAMSSMQGQDAVTHAMSFASNYITLITGDVEIMEGAPL